MRTFFLLTVFVCIIAMSFPASADFPIRQSLNGDDQPAVAYNSNDNRYLVVWNELIPLGQVYLIGPVMGQLITEGGALIGSAFQIFGNGVEPSVAYNSQTNEYLVTTTWMGIKGQRVSSVGTLLGTAVQLLDNASSSRIVYNSLAGNYLLAAVEFTENPAGSGYYDMKILTRKIAADGSPLGTAQVADSYSYQPGEVRYAIAYAPLQSAETAQGRYLLAAQTNIGVSLTMLNSEGARMFIVHDPQSGMDYQYIPFATGNVTGGEYHVDVAYGTESGYSMFGPAFLVVWGDNNNTWTSGNLNGEGGIWGGFVDAQKLEYLTTDPVQDNSFPLTYIYKHWTYSAYAETWKPVVAYNPIAEKYMVAWRETPGTEPENDTKVNHIRTNRAFVQIPPPTNVVLSATTGSEDPQNPAIAASTYSSNALVVWTDHRNAATTNWDIYGSLYTILPAVSITVTAPNGGETWVVNTQQEIKWTSTNFTDPVKILVSYDGYSPQFWQTIVQSTPNDGSYLWTVPSNTATNCVIRIEDAADGDPFDMSDAPFSIVVPFGANTFPGTNVQVDLGSGVSTMFDNVTTAGTTSLTTSQTGSPPPSAFTIIPSGSPTYYSITTTATFTGNIKVCIQYSDAGLTPQQEAVLKLQVYESGQWQDVTTSLDVNANIICGTVTHFSTFAVMMSTTTESITVISPNGNENWGAGSEQEIKWTSTNLTNPVHIEYSTDGGASYTVIVNSTANDGSYMWTIPNTPSSLCAVKILDAVDNDPWDISDAVFAIVPQAYPWMLVNNTQDYDPGSLRQAILDANAHAGPDTIRFAIPTYDPGFNADLGVWTIRPLSPLPSMADGGTVMDATTQTLWVGDTNPLGPEIEIDGSQAGALAHGIVLTSPDNAIYGLVINRFAGSGIVIAGAQSDSNVISMNYVGVNPTATAAAANGGAGIWIEDAPANFIPDLPAPLYANVIGGNAMAGIAILGTGAQGNFILCNYIGTDSTQSHNLGNQGDGILIAAGAANTVITGLGYPSEVVIKHNGGAGIRIAGSGTVTNAIWGGAISNNGGPGILLEEGGNDNMPAPIISEADSFHVAGTAPSDSWVQIYADEADEGAIFLGQTQCDATGVFYWNGAVVGPNVTATATILSYLSGSMFAGNTSMFSAPFPLAGGGRTWLVTNTNDAGLGSLRQAIQEANDHSGADSIQFQIATSDPGYDAQTGVWTIRPTSGAFQLTDDGTTIDGYTQPGASPNSNPFGQPINAVLKIVLDGSQVSSYSAGLDIRSSGNLVRGLVIQHFWDGIVIAQSGADNNRVEGNFIGTNVQGTAAQGNSRLGILISASQGNVIGGSAPQARNLIAGNSGAGVHIQSGADNNRVVGNYIGTDVSGTTALPNNNDGVVVVTAQYNQIGGTAEGEANLIAFNAWNGVNIYGGDGATNYNTISRNRIHSNTGNGIALISGGNAGLAAPTIVYATPTQVTGTAGIGHTIEVFTDENGEGRVYLGSTVADGSGNFVLTLSTPPVLPFVTATATDAAGNTSEFSSPFLITGVEDKPQRTVPKEFALSQNYPNPFNPETVIAYDVPRKSHVVLRITDLLGQEVVTLVDREQSPGYYSVSWDGSDRNGRVVASGIYVCSLRAHGFAQSRKLALIR